MGWPDCMSILYCIIIVYFHSTCFNNPAISLVFLKKKKKRKESHWCWCLFFNGYFSSGRVLVIFSRPSYLELLLWKFWNSVVPARNGLVSQDPVDLLMQKKSRKKTWDNIWAAVYLNRTSTRLAEVEALRQRFSHCASLLWREKDAILFACFPSWIFLYWCCILVPGTFSYRCMETKVGLSRTAVIKNVPPCFAMPSPARNCTLTLKTSLTDPVRHPGNIERMGTLFAGNCDGFTLELFVWYSFSWCSFCNNLKF